jgi:resuscitation-promoting factor RpfB
MKRAIEAALAVCVLLVVDACGSNGATPPVTVTTTTTVTASPTAAPTTAMPTPTVKTRTSTKRRAIPFATRTVHDPTLAKGSTRVRTRGAAGVKIFTYRVTFTNGMQTGKKLIRKVITEAPVARVIVVGTKKAPQCDPNYSGACVPIASDVDCAGGSGNGPAYVQGPVRVVGTDIYGLDADGDGIGCDS